MRYQDDLRVLGATLGLLLLNTLLDVLCLPQIPSRKMHGHFKRSAGIAEEYQLSSTAINQEAERCAVSDEAKRQIVNNIVHALSEFVEIESQDKVQLSFTPDTDLGNCVLCDGACTAGEPGYQEEERVDQ
ncbi:hypothetical protein NC652_026066 [Populus alba x Populus x berolinensis]|nr:hypothetical protein NC652_026066 [Populus alba x Populus x berolinensis]